MGLINKDFPKGIDNRFLTEEVSLFLYSLVRSCRPKNLLEIGAGYSTVFLAQSLKDIKDIPIDKEHHLYPDFWNKVYAPQIEVVENEIDNNCLKEVQSFLQSNLLNKYVKIINKDIYSYMDELKNSNKTYDFIWMDYGSGENYLEDFEVFESLLNPNGIIVVHSTLTNLYGKLFISEMKLQTKIGKYSHLEMISFLEPHKMVQNSFTVFKKDTKYPTYRIKS